MNTTLIILFPLIGFLYCLFLAAFVGRQLSIVITCGALLISAVLSLQGLYEIMGTGEISHIIIIHWIIANDFTID